MLTDWRLAAAAAIFCTGILFTCIETNAQSMPKDVAARTEIYAIPSLTISDQQFLTGDANGKAVTVAGEFRIAQGTGKLPVVVLMHGSSGVGASMDPWVHHFNAMGISTFVIDGFSGRGLTAVGPNQALLGRLNFIVDIYRALEILAKHPRVDPDRIVLMGFSRGGQAALYASLDRFHKLWNKSGAQFAAYIPFYPDCSTSYATDTETVARPIRIFHGTPDDYNPVASCKAYLARLQEAKRDVGADRISGLRTWLRCRPARRQRGHGIDQCAVRPQLPPQGGRRRRSHERRYARRPSPTRTPASRSIPMSAAIRRPRSEARKAVSDFLQALLRL